LSLSLRKERDVALRQGEVKHRFPLRTSCLPSCSLWFLSFLPQRAQSFSQRAQRRIAHGTHRLNGVAWIQWFDLR
jgi:hypothetical protein